MKKAFRTPTIKATVNYDPALLKSNHIYLAATDNEKIYVDDLFQQMPLYVRTYLLLHEEGHIIAGHPHKRNLDHVYLVSCSMSVEGLSTTLQGSSSFSSTPFLKLTLCSSSECS